ncbi:MAG: hypothetical protein IPK16_22760, partial [Anaerolineales bacterium]|nr:hypothetical protein [Anaerolineales bacterium]
EAGDAGILGLPPQRPTYGAGVVQDDRRSLACDAGLKQFHLLVGVVVMDKLEQYRSRVPWALADAISDMAPKNGFSTGGTITQIVGASAAASAGAASPARPRSSLPPRLP